MLKWLGTFIVLLSIITIQACAPKSQQACGFVQNIYGERISWKSDSPVTIQIHTSVPDSMVPAIQAAADTWEKTAGRKLFNVVTSPRYKGPVVPHQDGVNVIYFMNTWESNMGSEQARTSVYWIGDLIKEADMRINGADFGYYWKIGEPLTKAAKSERASAAPVNIEALVLHELGHVLGLKHEDSESSVMATYLAGGDDRIHLAEADQKALQCEY